MSEFTAMSGYRDYFVASCVCELLTLDPIYFTVKYPKSLILFLLRMIYIYIDDFN